MNKSRTILRSIYEMTNNLPEVQPGTQNEEDAIIIKAVEQYKDREEFHQIQDMVCDVVDRVQPYAFETGFQFAVSLLLECLMV